VSPDAGPFGAGRFSRDKRSADRRSADAGGPGRVHHRRDDGRGRVSGHPGVRARGVSLGDGADGGVGRGVVRHRALLRLGPGTGPRLARGFGGNEAAAGRAADAGGPGRVHHRRDDGRGRVGGHPGVRARGVSLGDGADGGVGRGVIRHRALLRNGGRRNADAGGASFRDRAYRRRDREGAGDDGWCPAARRAVCDRASAGRDGNLRGAPDGRGPVGWRRAGARRHRRNRA